MTRLGQAIKEICKWDKDFKNVLPVLGELEWESFRHRVKSAPVILNGHKQYYVRNQWQDGIKLANSFEMVEERQWVGNNPDLPDTLALDEMGVPGPSNREDFIWPAVDPNAPVYRRSTHLDGDTDVYFSRGRKDRPISRTVAAMNDRDFRDRCVQANGKLYVLYPMGLPELSPPNHLRAETIEGWLANPCRCRRECEHEQTEIPSYDADSIVKTLEKLQMSRQFTTKLMFGYMGSDREWRNGMKSMDAEDIKNLAYYLEDLEAQLPKLLAPGENEPVSLDDHRAYYLDTSYKFIEWGINSAGDAKWNMESVNDQIHYIETMAKEAYDEIPEPDQYQIDYLIAKGFGVEDEEESENQAYEDTDFKSVGDGWTAHPLHYGEDTVKYHWTACVRTAGVKRLWAWKRLMGKLKNITYRQRTDLWSRINDRQAQLIGQIENRLTPIVKSIIEEISSLSAGQAKALIYAYQVGGSFEAFTSFDFDEPGDAEMAFYLWDYHRKKF